MSEQGLPSTGRYVGPEEGTLKRLSIIAVIAVIAGLAVVGPAASHPTATQAATRIWHWQDDPDSTNGVDFNDDGDHNLSQGCSGYGMYDRWKGRIKVEPISAGLYGAVTLDYALGQIWEGSTAVGKRWSSWGGQPPNSAGTKTVLADGNWYSFNNVDGIGDDASGFTAASVSAFIASVSTNVKNVKIKVKPQGCVFNP